MLTFQQVLLNDVAPVRVADIIVGQPEIITSAKSKATGNGEYFARRRYSPRRVLIQFYFGISTPTRRAEWIRAINAWAHSDEPAELRIPHYPGMYLMATCTSPLPEFSATEQSQIMELEFTAHDPAFTEDEERLIPCGVPFEIRGSHAASGYIEQVIAVSTVNPSWALDSTYTIALSHTYATGTLIADLDDKSVYLGTTPQMDKVTLASRFFELTPGIHTIVGGGSLHYRERWI